jgi:AcrR family transcriptional regulator
MKKRQSPEISARKAPKQDRSSRFVEDILEAAVRVLKREGARRFTTVRVAEEAGVSVGSLYQYFPNKESLLFRLQADEWNDTWSLCEEILGDARLEPFDRLRRFVLVFFRSEHEEAALRVALADAGAVLRDTPEEKALHVRTEAQSRAFLAEAIPGASPRERAFAADFVFGSMFAVAESITARGLSRAEVDAWARASAEMYCGYLIALEKEKRLQGDTETRRIKGSKQMRKRVAENK